MPHNHGAPGLRAIVPMLRAGHLPPIQPCGLGHIPEPRLGSSIMPLPSRGDPTSSGSVSSGMSTRGCSKPISDAVGLGVGVGEGS